MTSPKLSLTLKTKSKKKKSNASDLQHAFGSEPVESKNIDDSNQPKEPLVIPVAENKLKFRGNATNIQQEDDTHPLSHDDAQALEALQSEATQGTSNHTRENHKLRIDAAHDTFQRETRQYQDDLAELPDEAPLESYQRVQIADFGAALLRGMGWEGDDNDKSKKEDSMSMPRPHRLGLGATPKLVDMMPPTSGRPRRPDQVQRHEALKKQQEEYQKQREQQTAMDKQRTLQNGSLVHLMSSRQRARIVQLVGVPGLNQVQVQFEGDATATIVKRADIGDLVTRQELHDEPFVETELKQSQSSNNRDRGADRDREKDRNDSKRSHREDTSRRRDDDKTRKDKRRDRDDSDSKRKSSDDRPSKRRKEVEPSPSWIIPNIRVRVITEKLGRRYYKEKAIVVDVTRKGATLKLPNGQVLDRVPERYLETALPKVGGKVVVLAGEHQYSKGSLLERDSKRSKGVLQVFEDLSVLTLSLDDMAEWCGPLDETLEG